MPSLNPMYGLGSYGRTGAAILTGGSRARTASQGRIYSWMNSRGLGYQYVQFLLNTLGKAPYVNPWSLI